VTYCAACHRSVARADRVERDGEGYHRQCAPDGVVTNEQLQAFGEDTDE